MKNALYYLNNLSTKEGKSTLVGKEAAMERKIEDKKQGKAKGFFRGLMEKIDKKMEEKSKSQPCCCQPRDQEGGSCCG